MRLWNRALLRDFLGAVDDPAGAQRARLAAIVGRNTTAGYLTHHGAASATDPDSFRKALPIVTYDDLWPWIEPLVETGQPGPRGTVTADPVHMFLKTSGTTGRAKHLPVTEALEAETDRARRIWIERMIAEDERNALGCHLAVVSPMHESLTPGGLPVGSNTGRIFMRQPEIVRAFAPVPYPVFGLGDFDLRYYLILRFAAGRYDVGTLSTANPSTVLLLCRKLLQHLDEIADDIASGVVCQGERARVLEAAFFVDTQDRAMAMAAMSKDLKPNPARAAQVRAAAKGGAEGLLHRLWPELTTVNCWLGGHAPLYLGRLAPFLATPGGPLPLRDPGFSASEGNFGIPLRSGTSEGILHTLGSFMEFVPEGEDSEETLLAHELEIGGRYRIITTTSGGLWRYDMRDVIEVTGMLGATPLVRFLYKSGGTLSVTGEKITEDHAIKVAAGLVSKWSFENACATFEFVDPPRYVVAVEAAEPIDTEALALDWDKGMKTVNIEYAEKRRSGRLGPPRVAQTPSGAFDGWRRRRVAAGAPDGQVKLPPLMRSLEDLEEAFLREGEP